MKNTTGKGFFESCCWFRYFNGWRKPLHFLVIVMCFSSLSFCDQLDEILFQLQQKKVTTNYSAKLQVVIKTPFAPEQVFAGEMAVSGNSYLVDFSKQKGLIFLKTTTANYQISSDGLVEDLSLENPAVNHSYTVEKMIKNYRLEIMNVSGEQVILAGFSKDQQIGNLRMYISKPDYLLQKIEISKDDDLICVENSYFDNSNIPKSQKTTVSTAGIVITNETNYSGLVINPTFQKDHFTINRLISLVKNVKENAHE